MVEPEERACCGKPLQRRVFMGIMKKYSCKSINTVSFGIPPVGVARRRPEISIVEGVTSEVATMTELPKRKNIRLNAENYAMGGYFFITVCVRDRKQILGTIRNGTTELTDIGKLIEEEINLMSSYHDSTEIVDVVIMPDHVHFIMRYEGAKTHFGRIVGNMKSAVTRRLGYSIWQRNYYEHIIRNETELLETQRYMQDNPLRWELRCKGLV
ncbi:MAG: transposase [Selenomonadaceae bacterium]|nr:transposase [Selenomonadaceae bacterium]